MDPVPLQKGHCVGMASTAPPPPLNNEDVSSDASKLVIGGLCTSPATAPLRRAPHPALWNDDPGGEGSPSRSGYNFVKSLSAVRHAIDHHNEDASIYDMDDVNDVEPTEQNNLESAGFQPR